MKTVIVICCNDSIECAVAEGADKDAVLDRMAKKHYDRSKHNYESYEEYRKICYWHFHEVAVLDK